MNVPLHPRVPGTSRTCPGKEDWPHCQLSEARGVLADAAHHPDTLVILACRTIAAHSRDGRELEDALILWRKLDKRPLAEVAPTAFAKGGDA